MKAFKCDVCRIFLPGDPDANISLSSVKSGLLPINYDICKPCLSDFHRFIRDEGTDAQAVIAEVAREYVRIGYAMGDCSGNILPLLKAQSAAYDALVAAVDAEETGKLE